MRSADPALMARAHRISDAHMVCTPHPRISRIFSHFSGCIGGVWISYDGLAQEGRKLLSRFVLTILSSLFHVKERGRVCCDLSRYLMQLKNTGKPW